MIAPPALAVEVRGVTKRYDDRPDTPPALADVDLDVGAGELVVLMGPSGSGKSTLLHLLGALDHPATGEVRVGGRDLARLSARELADYRNQEVGFVFQMLNLIPTLTAEENVWLPAAVAGVERARVRARADELFERMGVAAKRARFPQELSGGEQQRVAIVRALLLEPALLLADEPTGSLDAASSERVMDVLADVHRDGQAIVLATHDPRVASAADRVVCLRDGRVEHELDLRGPGEGPASRAGGRLDQVLAVTRDHA